MRGNSTAHICMIINEAANSYAMQHRQVYNVMVLTVGYPVLGLEFDQTRLLQFHISFPMKNAGTVSTLTLEFPLFSVKASRVVLLIWSLQSS
jgi:hypothetical protein